MYPTNYEKVAPSGKSFLLGIGSPFRPHRPEFHHSDSPLFRRSSAIPTWVFDPPFSVISESIPNILYIKLKLRISSKCYNNAFLSKIKTVDCESILVNCCCTLTFLNLLKFFPDCSNFHCLSKTSSSHMILIFNRPTFQWLKFLPQYSCFQCI